MRYRFVGDIHGQLEILDAFLDCDADKIIFVGEFMDSWRRSPEDQIQCVRRVLKEIEDGRAEAVFGNHEMSYISPEYRCTGHTAEAQTLFDHIKYEVLEKFKPFVSLANGKILVTHAGLTRQLWEAHNLTTENYQQALTEWFHEGHTSPFFQVGQRRGGVHPFGGPLWCDFMEFQSVPEIYQIFGHSRGARFRHLDSAVCIDVNENGNPEALDMEILPDVE